MILYSFLAVRSILKSPGIDGTIDVQSQVGFGTRMVISFQAHPATHSPGSTWTRNPIAFDPKGCLRFALIGFPDDNRSTLQLATLLRQHLQRWYGDIAETDPSDAAFIIVNGDLVHHSILNSVNRSQQKILVLSSSPVDPGLLTVAQQLSLNGGFCLVTLKPVGPHALARLLSKMVDPLLPRSPARPSPGRMISSDGKRAATLAPSQLSPLINVTPEKAQLTPVEELPRPQDMKPRALVVEDNPVRSAIDLEIQFLIWLGIR